LLILLQACEAQPRTLAVTERQFPGRQMANDNICQEWKITALEIALDVIPVRGN